MTGLRGLGRYEGPSVGYKSTPPTMGKPAQGFLELSPLALSPGLLFPQDAQARMSFLRDMGHRVTPRPPQPPHPWTLGSIFCAVSLSENRDGQWNPGTLLPNTSPSPAGYICTCITAHASCIHISVATCIHNMSE